jgi:hypothetical protein
MLVMIVLLFWSAIKFLSINIFDFSNKDNIEELENTGTDISFVAVDEDLT